MGHTQGDIRARMAAKMLNEDFQKALDRITSKSSEIDAMTADQKKIISDKLTDTADYIDNFGPISDIKNYFVEVKGFSEGDWDNIEKLLQKESDSSLKAFTNYIKNPVSVDYFTKMTSPTDVPSQMEKDFGLPKRVVGELFSMEGKQKSGKGVGRGELFLGFMINGATNASVGDVNVDGQPYEVKAKDARLNTQNGFGTGQQAILSFFKEFGKRQINMYVWSKYSMNKASKTTIQEFNFLKGGKSRFYDLFQDVAAESNNPKKDLHTVFELLADTMFCSTSGIWMNASSSIRDGVVDAFKKYVNDDGTPSDDTMLNYALMWQNILYYQSQEYFNGIFLIEPKVKKLAYLPVSSSNDMTGWLSKNVKYTQPSWQDKPTSDAWKISLNK